MDVTNMEDFLQLGAVENTLGFIRDYAELTMLKKMGQPGELGGVVVFLASDASNYITGHNLVVDGGFTRYK